MPALKRLYIIFGLVTLFVSVGFDQLSKWTMLDVVHLAGRGPITVAPFFDLTLVWNQGISFGLFAGLNQPMTLMTVSGAILIVLFIWLCKAHSATIAGALGSVMGGAIGNMIDRVRYGAVVDFLDFHIGRMHWPAFNIADSAIFIGVVLLCLDGMFTKRLTKTEGSHT